MDAQDDDAVDEEGLEEEAREQNQVIVSWVYNWMIPRMRTTDYKISRNQTRLRISGKCRWGMPTRRRMDDKMMMNIRETRKMVKTSLGWIYQVISVSRC